MSRGDGVRLAAGLESTLHIYLRQMCKHRSSRLLPTPFTSKSLIEISGRPLISSQESVPWLLALVGRGPQACSLGWRSQFC